MSRNIDDLFDNDKRPFFMVACGKSMKGKSHFIKFLITDRFKQGKLKFALVFTTTKFNKDYDFLPEKSIMEGYDEEILEQYVNNLKQVREKEGKVEPNVIIFEDCVGILNNQTNFFTNWVSMCRHLNTSVILSGQYLLGRNAISPICREQITHCLMFQSRTKRTIEALYNSFGGLFDSEKLFKEYFFQATKQPYTAMLYIEQEDDIDKNYITVIAPEKYQQYKITY